MVARGWRCRSSINERAVLDANLMVGQVSGPTSCAQPPARSSRRPACAPLPRPAEEIALSYRERTRGFPLRSRHRPLLAEMLDIAEKAETSPVILADPADNPTGWRCWRSCRRAERADRAALTALIAGITDRLAAVEACFAVGKGATLVLDDRRQPRWPRARRPRCRRRWCCCPIRGCGRRAPGGRAHRRGSPSCSPGAPPALSQHRRLRPART